MQALAHGHESVPHGFKVGVGTLAAAALYERVLARDLTKLDSDALCRTWSSREEVRREVEQAHSIPNLAAYSASKRAVIALTKALVKEVAREGVYVNCLAPVVIDTAMNKAVTPEMLEYMVSRIPLGRVGQPEEVAELIAWVASDACCFTTGFCFDSSGGRATY
jgi:NAD(P)-dependent dehydrogenase (short-subunit alcohol dehydrogenase family)